MLCGTDREAMAVWHESRGDAVRRTSPKAIAVRHVSRTASCTAWVARRCVYGMCHETLAIHSMCHEAWLCGRHSSRGVAVRHGSRGDAVRHVSRGVCCTAWVARRWLDGIGHETLCVRRRLYGNGRTACAYATRDCCTARGQPPRLYGTRSTRRMYSVGRAAPAVRHGCTVHARSDGCIAWVEPPPTVRYTASATAVRHGATAPHGCTVHARRDCCTAWVEPPRLYGTAVRQMAHGHGSASTARRVRLYRLGRATCALVAVAVRHRRRIAAAGPRPWHGCTTTAHEQRHRRARCVRPAAQRRSRTGVRYRHDLSTTARARIA